MWRRCIHRRSSGRKRRRNFLKGRWWHRRMTWRRDCWRNSAPRKVLRALRGFQCCRVQSARHFVEAAAGRRVVCASADCHGGVGNFVFQQRVANGGMDGGAWRDGRGLHPECKTMRASALLRDGAILSGDGGDRTSVRIGSIAAGARRMEFDRADDSHWGGGVMLPAGTNPREI